MPSPDVRVRVRPAVVRVRVSETVVRTVVRVTTRQQDYPISTPVFLLNYVSDAMICKPSPEVRVRARPAVARVRVSETVARTVGRATTQQQDLSRAVSVVVVTVAVNTATAKRIRKNVKVCTPHKFPHPT